MWKENEWESVGFQLSDWFDKSKWITRFKSKNTTPNKWCSLSMDTDKDSTKNYDSMWETTAQFWDANSRTLLVDFQRPMDVPGFELKAESYDALCTYMVQHLEAYEPAREADLTKTKVVTLELMDGSGAFQALAVSVTALIAALAF